MNAIPDERIVLKENANGIIDSFLNAPNSDCHPLL